MVELNRNYIAKFYNFFYFIFWGFYFSAGYLFCTKKYFSKMSENYS